MFEIEEYKRVSSKLNDYKEKKKHLEELKSEVDESMIFLQNNCFHDLILCYEKDDVENIKKAKCLVCDNYFELEGTFDLFTEKDVDANSIIDVTDIVSEKSQRTIRGEDNILFLKAKESLSELVEYLNDNNTTFPLELVKSVIRNDIISYKEELNKNVKKKIKRNDNNE